MNENDITRFDHLSIEAAVLPLRQEASAGDVNAQVTLARVLLRKKELAQDSNEAEHLLTQASASGHVFAQALLGSLLRSRGDLVNAEVLLRKASEAGNSDACIELGMIYLSSDGPLRNVHKARECFEMAARSGDGMALANLGIMHANGVGLKKNPCKGALLLGAASACGNASASGLLEEVMQVALRSSPIQLQKLLLGIARVEEEFQHNSRSRIGTFVIENLDTLITP